MGQKADGESPFKKQQGREPNSIIGNLSEKFKVVSEEDRNLVINPSDFEEDVDSTILVRERTRGSKLEPCFKKKSGKIIKETGTTITILPENKKRTTLYSNRDVAKPPVVEETETESSSEEEYVPQDETEQRQEGQSSSSVVEIAPPKDRQNLQEPPVAQVPVVEEKSKKEEEASPKKVKVPVKGKVLWQKEKKEKVKKREMVRRRRPTKRFGIDEVMKVDHEEFAIWNEKGEN